MKETKTSKKSVMFGVIMVLLIAVIAFGSTTFAKYITSSTSGAQSARVAKWGFTVSADTNNLFGDKYTLNTEKTSAVVVTDTGVAVTADTANENVVAPGTSGYMTFTIGMDVNEGGWNITQKAEVRSKLTVVMQKSETDESDPEEIVLKNTTDNSTYNPVKWTLKQGNAVVCGDVTLAEIKTELESYATANADIAPGSRIINAGVYTLEWKWDFNNGNDENDTRLGQIMNGETITGYEATKEISFCLKIGIEQIQSSEATTPTT